MRHALQTAAVLLALATTAPPVLADSLGGTASDEGWALETPGLSDDGIFALPDSNLLTDQPGEEDWLLMPPEDDELGGDWLLPETSEALPMSEPPAESGN